MGMAENCILPQQCELNEQNCNSCSVECPRTLVQGAEQWAVPFTEALPSCLTTLMFQVLRLCSESYVFLPEIVSSAETLDYLKTCNCLSVSAFRYEIQLGLSADRSHCEILSQSGHTWFAESIMLVLDRTSRGRTSLSPVELGSWVLSA